MSSVLAIDAVKAVKHTVQNSGAVIASLWLKLENRSTPEFFRESIAGISGLKRNRAAH